MAFLTFDHALLPEGWRRDVTIGIEHGRVVTVTSGAVPPGTGHVRGIALPGIASLHSHTFQRAMAGLAEMRGPVGDTFWTWRQVMYRFLGVLEPEDIEAIAAFAFMEMLEGGFTRVGEFHYLHHGRDGTPYANLAELSERIAAGAASAGIGLTLLPSLYTHSGFGGAPPVEGQRRFINDNDRFNRLMEGAARAIAPLGTANLGIAPHSLRAVAPEGLARIVADHPGLPVHIHAAEQVREVADCLAWSGLRPVEWLLAHMPVGERWCLVHATHLSPEEARAFARSGASAGLCPITEASLGDGIFPGPDFLDAGGNFGVGTDSNIEISAPGELRQFEYHQRLGTLGRNIVARAEGHSTGRALWEGAARGGARALGRLEGRIAPGHAADFVVLDAANVNLAHVEGDRWLDALIFTAGKSAIRDIHVGGERVVAEGRHIRHEAILGAYSRTLARLAAL
jgi:formiminoglutamate deiminase